MSKYTVDDIVDGWNLQPEDVDIKNKLMQTVAWAHSLLNQAPPGSFVVIPYYEAPEFARKVTPFNGGDEDWMVLSLGELTWLPFWLERIDVGQDPDEYVLCSSKEASTQAPGTVHIYVGSH